MKRKEKVVSPTEKDACNEGGSSGLALSMCATGEHLNMAASASGWAGPKVLKSYDPTPRASTKHQSGWANARKLSLLVRGVCVRIFACACWCCGGITWDIGDSDHGGNVCDRIAECSDLRWRKEKMTCWPGRGT